MSRIVLSMLAEDRPGIVEELSEVALENGANWLESRMAQLAGQFSGLVLMEVSDDRQTDLLDALHHWAADDVQILIKQGTSRDLESPGAGVTISLDGADHPGLVHQLSELLASHDVNIVELETDQHAAAMSGQPIFTAQIQAVLPTELSVQALGDALGNLAEELMVEIRMQHRDISVTA